MSELDNYKINYLNGTDNHHYYQHVTDKFWYTKKIYENVWLHYDRKKDQFHEFADLQSFVSFLQNLHEQEKKTYIQEIIKTIKVLRSDKMHILDLSKSINETFRRTIKLKKDGTLAHTIDKDVLNVVAIAIASDILDAYDISKKKSE